MNPKLRNHLEQEAHQVISLHGCPGDLRGKAAKAAVKAAIKAIAKKPHLIGDMAKIRQIMAQAVERTLIDQYFKFEVCCIDHVDLESLNPFTIHDPDLLELYCQLEQMAEIRKHLIGQGLTEKVIDALIDGDHVAAIHALIDEESARGHALSDEAAAKRISRALAKTRKVFEPRFDH